jgi:sec-independent protein translocase protein TatC
MKAKQSGENLSFLGHLEALRWHLIRMVVAVVVCAVVAFSFSNIIFDSILLAPRHPEFITNRLLGELAAMLGLDGWKLNPNPLPLQNITMSGQFTTDISISMIAGFILAFPYVAWEVWSFVAPALYENERRVARGAVGAISVLFLLGIMFGYFIIVPFSVHFLGGYTVSAEVVNVVNLNSYFSTVSSITLASGLLFELPVVVYFLTKVGLLTPEFMIRYRRHAIVVLLVIAAVITPPEVFSQILVMIPLLALYELSVWLSRRVVKQKANKLIKNES